MSAPDLHKFKRDLKQRPAPGSNAPPRSIRAVNLDDNFEKVTLVKNEKQAKLYEVRYTDDGTQISQLFPGAKRRGDMIYWNGERWEILQAATSSSMRVLTLTGGVLRWTQTEDC